MNTLYALSILPHRYSFLQINNVLLLQVIPSSNQLSVDIQTKTPTTLTRSNEIEYEFGKSMHEYAKRLQRNNTQKKTLSTSKSDGDLVDSKTEVNHCKSGNSSGNNFSKHDHHNHQQCCTGFGSGSRHRFQSNACEIV